MNQLTLNLTTVFSPEELGLLQRQLEYAAAQPKGQPRLTFREFTRLLHWQSCYTTLAHAITAALAGQPDFSLPSAGPTWRSFLRCERCRAESALHRLEDKALPNDIKQDLVHYLDLEARLYGLLLDQLTSDEPEAQPAVEMTSLLFVSVPKTLLK